MYINSYGGVGIIDPGINPNSNSHPILLYLEKTSPGSAIHIGMRSSTNFSPAIYASSMGGNAIHGNASNAGYAGVYGNSTNGYGLQGYSYYSYGLVARSDNYYGMVAVGKTYAAYFVGSTFASGGYHVPSDQKLKKNIEEVTSATDIISQLHPKKYYYLQDGHHKLMSLPQEEQYGLLAQEVEKVLPGLVKDTKFETGLAAAPKKPDANGKFDLPQEVKSETIEFKALNYTGLIPILIKGMQEQQEKINSQDKKIETLNALVNELLAARSSLGNTGAMNRGDAGSIALLTQNAPNPFHQTTTISYYLPQEAGNAAITITDTNGKLVKTYNLSEKGNGQLVIEGGQLTPGMYYYSLMLEGKVITTKKMILLK